MLERRQGKKNSNLGLLYLLFTKKQTKKKISLLRSQLSFPFLPLIDFRKCSKQKGAPWYEFLFYSLSCTHIAPVNLKHKVSSLASHRRIIFALASTSHSLPEIFLACQINASSHRSQLCFPWSQGFVQGLLGQHGQPLKTSFEFREMVV